MNSIKHLIQQVSFGDYLIIIVIVASVYFLASYLDNRQRVQLTLLILFLVVCVRLIIGISFVGALVTLINRIHFIYIWAPLSLSIFLISMLYEKGRLKAIVVRSVIISICICASLYFIFS